MSNASKLPSKFTLYTDNRLSTVTFSQDDIGKIIQNLNPHKAHGHDSGHATTRPGVVACTCNPAT